eukprot:6041147-Amphidinium_carterae.1
MKHMMYVKYHHLTRPFVYHPSSRQHFTLYFCGSNYSSCGAKLVSAQQSDACSWHNEPIPSQQEPLVSLTFLKGFNSK